MFVMTDRTTTNTILATFTALDIKPPKAISAAYARAEKLNAGLPHLTPTPGALEQAVTAAILADRDVTTDAGVQSALVAQQLAANVSLPDVLTAGAAEAIRDACLTHLDDIVAAWRKGFHQAALTLSSAHADIGNLPLDDTTTILARGGNIAEVWAAAKSAEQVIDQVLAGWSSLMQFVRVPLNAEHRALRLAALDAQQWRTVPTKAKPWDVVLAGLTLDLPTLDEYRARVARLEQSRAAEAAAEAPVDREREATKSWARRMAAAEASR